ncbi:MAG: ABC transporter ATP-binding protein [Rhizobacter sp.]
MLSIEHLGYRYSRADTAALDGVSLVAQRGSVLGLLGPNGAGKTTLISHLAGLLPVQQGQILIDGEALANVRTAQPTRIAVAPQEYAFYSMLTVTENLACFAAAGRLSGSKLKERIAACLAFAQLERYQHTRAEQLSGGLKRRLNLAIALLPEPELMLFDEPTVGVDPQSRAFILDAIKTLARNGAAVIYTSHYMDEIEAIADQVVILDHGRVLRAGSLDDLLAQDELVMTLAADGIAPEALLALLTQHGTVETTTPRISLRLRSQPAVLLAALDAAGAQVRHAEFGRGNLEQLFMSLTKRSLRD